MRFGFNYYSRPFENLIFVVSTYSLWIKDRLVFARNPAIYIILMNLLFCTSFKSAGRAIVLATLILITLPFYQIIRSGMRLFNILSNFGINLLNFRWYWYNYNLFLDDFSKVSGCMGKLIANVLHYFQFDNRLFNRRIWLY